MKVVDSMVVAGRAGDFRTSLQTLYRWVGRRLFGYDIFISYSRIGGSEYARVLHFQLSKLGYAVFLDRQEGLYGEELTGKLLSLLRRSQALIVIVTPDALESRYVDYEIESFARLHSKRRRPLIPIGTPEDRNDCANEHLKFRVWIDESESGGLPPAPSQRALGAIVESLVARKRMRLLMMSILLSVATFIAVGRIAQEQFQLARSREFASAAEQRLSDDPNRAIEFAIRAARSGQTPEAEKALSASLLSEPLKMILRHDAYLLDSDFSPSGALVLTSAYDGRVRLWDPVTGSELRNFRAGPDFNDAHASFSPDGGQIATLSSDGSLHLWDTRNVREPVTLDSTLKYVSVAFGPSGSNVISLSDGGLVQIW